MSWKFLSRATKQTSKKILNLSLATIIGVSGVFSAVPFLFSTHAAAFDATFYVNSSWLGTTPGTDPDGAGPAANFGADSFSTIQAAVTAAGSGDTINVAPGSYTEVGQIVINKDLNIVGADKATTIIKPAQDTTNSGDTRGWFLIPGGSTFNLSNVTLDGTDHLIYMGLYYWGNGTVNDVNITNIKYQESGPAYDGRGIMIKGNVNVTNSTFANIGRIGIQYFGGNGTASGNTYVGKGAGDWLDYAFDIDTGSNVNVENNTISNNLGVASSDHSGSAAILVSTIYGPGTTSTITGNTLTNNSIAIAVGYDESDTSVAVAHNNKMSGNAEGVVSTAQPVDATSNWWGDASGPQASDNTTGTGSSVTGNVSYFPWCTNVGCTQDSTSLATMGTGPYFIRSYNSGDVAAIATVPEPATSVTFHFKNIATNVVTDVAGIVHLQAGQWPHNGLAQWRAGYSFAEGTYTVTASYVVDGTSYDANGQATTYVLGNDTGAFVIPSPSNHYFRSSDNPLRVTAGDTNNQFRDVVFNVNSTNYTVNRAQCDLREAGNYVLCDINQASNWGAGLTDGTYTATATIYNQASNHTQIASQSFTIDNTRPTLSNFKITNTQSVYGSSVAVSADATDSGSGINNVTFYLTAPRTGDGVCDGNGTQLSSAQGTLSSGSTYNGTLNTSGLDGSYCLNAVAEDNATNHSLPVVTIKVTLDNIAPVVRITAPNDGALVHGTVTISGTVTDTNPDHYYLVIKNSRGNAVAGPGTVYAANVADYHWNTTSLADGTYTIDLEARDAAGNKDASSVQTISVTVDNTEPTLTITSETQNVDGTYTVTGTTTDPSSDVVVTLDSTTLATVTPDGSGNWSTTTGVLAASSTHTIAADSTDAAGNSATEQTASFTVPTPPATTTNTPTTTPGAVLGTNTGGTGGGTGGGNTGGNTGNGGTSSDPTAVLSTNTTSPSTSTPAPAAAAAAAASSTSTSGKFWGLMWYWWLLILAIIGGLFYLLSRRRSSDQGN